MTNRNSVNAQIQVQQVLRAHQLLALVVIEDEVELAEDSEVAVVDLYVQQHATNAADRIITPVIVKLKP